MTHSSLFDQRTARAPSTPTASQPQAPDPVAEPPRSATGRTPRLIRDAGQELLKHGLVEERSKPNVYRLLLAETDAIQRLLEPLDLAMRVDEVRGLAFVVVADATFESQDDAWSHPLVRRLRLNLEQSLLIAILRQQFVAYELEAGVGAGEAEVALEDLLPHLQIYLGELGSDAQEKKRLLALLEQLKGHGLVSDVDEHERVTIRPIIAHVANPENLHSLIQALKGAARAPDVVEGEG